MDKVAYMACREQSILGQFRAPKERQRESRVVASYGSERSGDT